MIPENLGKFMEGHHNYICYKTYSRFYWQIGIVLCIFAWIFVIFSDNKNIAFSMCVLSVVHHILSVYCHIMKNKTLKKNLFMLENMNNGDMQ